MATTVSTTPSAHPKSGFVNLTIDASPAPWKKDSMSPPPTLPTWRPTVPALELTGEFVSERLRERNENQPSSPFSPDSTENEEAVPGTRTALTLGGEFYDVSLALSRLADLMDRAIRLGELDVDNLPPE